MTSTPPPESPPEPSLLPPATTRSALPSVVARAVSLLLAFAFAWYAVDRGLALWVQHEDAIVGRIAHFVPRPDPEQLQGLLALGEPDAPMTAVLACDVATPRCRQQLATLVAWQGRASQSLRRDDAAGEGMRRLVFLTRPNDADGAQMAQAVHALDAQGRLWNAADALAKDPTRWTLQTLPQALQVADADATRLARDRDDPDTVLAVQIERTMAEALEMPRDSGVLAAGLPVAATQSDGVALLAVLDHAEAQLAENMKLLSGDVPAAQVRGLAALSPRARDRFIRWILVGKKVSSFHGQASGGAESDGDDSDEPGEGDE